MELPVLRPQGSPLPNGDRANADPYDLLRYAAGVLKYIDAAVTEGEAVLRDEPMYGEMDKAISFIMGDQLDGKRPEALANFVDNRIKHNVAQTTSALTDIRPLFGFKTFNPQFASQADVLDKLVRSWWVNTFADLQLADVIKFAAGPGTGYCKVDFDASASGGVGDIVLRPIDPRDVLPIRPTLDRSLQSWEGVVIRRAATINELRARYPQHLGSLQAENVTSMATRTWGRAKMLLSNIVSAGDSLSQNQPRNAVQRVPTATVYETYIKDRTLWTGAEPITMGDPTTAWCYTVYPVNYVKEDGTKATVQESRVYPRGRLIISTKKALLYDGPNPYWHGLFPISRLQLDPWPWSILAPGLCHDLMPLQQLINEIINGVVDHTRKVLRPAVKADKKSIPDAMWARLDTRVAGLKMKTNPAAGAGVEFISPEALDPSVFKILELAVGEMDTLSGTANLTALTQLQQAPGADSIERMMEALTPVLRMKGRLLEGFLREIGEMVKSDFFQFYNLPRRVAMLGAEGVDAFSDFDFDPGSLVPAMSEKDDDYVPQLNKDKSRGDRAQWHHQNFVFQITPNSLLQISQISKKLLYLQLRRADPTLIDRWSLYEVLEIPNGGSPPAGSVTITDRVKEEMMLFPPPDPMMGRPPTAQQPPSLQVKGDGRPVVAES